MDWKHKRERATGRQATRPAFPIIQWNHAEGAWELPIAWFDATDVEAGEGAPCIDRSKMPAVVEIDHNGTQDTGWLFSTLHVLVLASRTRWQLKDDQGQVRLAPPGLERPHEHGYRSKTTALVVVAELWKASYKGICIITTHAVASQQFGAALRRLDAFIDRADELAGEEPGEYYPRYAFWLELNAGEVRLIGSGQRKSKVCDILCPLPDPKDQEALAAVDKEMVESLQIRPVLKEPVEVLYDAAQAWLDELAARAAQRSGQQDDAPQGRGRPARRFAEEEAGDPAVLPRPAGRSVGTAGGGNRQSTQQARAAASRPGPAARRT